MNQPKVYADITFLVNFTMDFMILWATAKLSGRPIVYGRCIIASLLGGIYGVAYLFPEMSTWYSLPAKIIFSCIIIVAAFGHRGWKDLKKTLICFYGVSFIMAGATIAVSYLSNNSQGLSFSYWWLLVGIICAFLLGSYGGKYISAKIIPALLKYRVELHFGDAICRGEGFLDTGNGLRDPLTQRPVVVAEYELLKECFPDDCRAVMDNFSDDNDILQGLSMSSWANRIRVIPFSSIGKKNGLMVGLRCDEIVVDPDKINLLHKNLVVGIYLDKLSTKENYQLLIPSEILQKI
ncbi:MAG: sigma-E processing peptidase SpoIIGA [Firmicutes bacterium HGW-Firmicutes-15]|nr:MAG: sigma-E processing peptidase SpoIIGA [Firmicutes bacterium HGW-Firmicutes-15]